MNRRSVIVLAGLAALAACTATPAVQIGADGKPLPQVYPITAANQNAILMLHDWGCLFGYQFAMRHPDLVTRIVGVDIGDGASLQKSLTAKEKLMVLTYQMWLAAAWKLGGTLGDRMTRSMARTLRCPSDPAPIGSQMNYPYFNFWFGGRESYRMQSRRFVPPCPMLFIYGRKKPLMFHARAWAEDLAKQPGNAVVAFETGHWVMTQQPERFNQVVSDWL